MQAAVIIHKNQIALQFIPNPVPVQNRNPKKNQ